MLKYKQRQKKTLNHKNESILKLTKLSKKIMNKLCSHLNSQIPKCRKRKKEKNLVLLHLIMTHIPMELTHTERTLRGLCHFF